MRFNLGDEVEWQNRKGTTMRGVIIYILEPGELAEDVLDEKDRTRISTKNLGAKIIPGTRRALIKVVDENGWVTYHTQKLGTLTRKERVEEPSIADVMKELGEIREMTEMLCQTKGEYRSGNARIRTVMRE
jgi:hypothetical protein